MDQSAIRPTDDLAGAMFGHHPEDNPALLVSDTKLVDVLDEAAAIASVIVTVVLCGNFVLPPAQVEYSDQLPAAMQR